MKTIFYIAALLFLCPACRKFYYAPIPSLDWSEFNSAQAISLKNATGQKMEGVYNFVQGSDQFGIAAAAKWTYTVNGLDTTFHLSFFCEKDVTYFICEGRRVDSTILLNGYWRRMVGTETGRVRLTIASATGGSKIVSTAPFNPVDNIIISGLYGNGDAVPDLPLQLQYNRALYNARPMEIVAHRGGGRTSDLLPASENSVEIIKLASRYGATGIEIDARMTSDGVLVLFHDGTLNERLIQKNGMVGPIENYSYAQLTSLVRLINGERIPTLREALTTALYSTPLRYVWLDTKFTGPIQKLRDIQIEFQQKALIAGRNLTITIGIPDRDVLAEFKKLTAYQNIPSVNELDPQDVRDVNSAIWAPRFTLGLQNDEVDGTHTEGRKAYVWTLDIPANIKDYLYNGHFDGLLSNYPSAVAYYYYAKQ